MVNLRKLSSFFVVLFFWHEFGDLTSKKRCSVFKRRLTIVNFGRKMFWPKNFFPYAWELMFNFYKFKKFKSRRKKN